MMSVYQKVGWVAIGVGVVMMAIAPFIKKFMHLDTLANEDEGDDAEATLAE